MVGRGEVLERMTTVAVGDVLLEALWQGGGIAGPHRAPVLLCPPHPRLGGSMDSAVLAELVWNLGRSRHPTLRFNHRGVGASQGVVALPPLPTTEPVDLGPLVEDAAAALAQLLASTGARTASVVGVSVGALVAARLLATHDGVDRGVLVAPPLDGVGGAALDLEGVVGAGCPVTLVVGEDDRVVDAARLQGLAHTAAGPLCPVRVVPGADHLFQRGLTALARLVVDALSGPDEELM